MTDFDRKTLGLPGLFGVQLGVARLFDKPLALPLEESGRMRLLQPQKPHNLHSDSSDAGRPKDPTPS